MQNVRRRVSGEFRKQMKEYVARLRRDTSVSIDEGTITLPADSLHFFVQLPRKGPATIEIVAPGTLIDGWLADVLDSEYESVSASSLGTERGDWPELRRNPPGPPKQFPHRLEFRYDDATKTALDILKNQSGDDASAVIRRLIIQNAN